MEPHEILEKLQARWQALGYADSFKAGAAPGLAHSNNKRTPGYTRLWLNDDDVSKHQGDDAGSVAGEIRYKSCKIELKTETEKDDDDQDVLHIQGWASTDDLDLDNEIVEPGAFKNSLADFIENKGTMLFMHDWYAVPVGKWLDATIKTRGKSRGLYMDDGIIMPTTLGKDIQIAIEHDAINTLSIGFRVITDEYDYDTSVRTIKDLQLLEISIVSIPANPNAIFEQQKELALKSFNRPAKARPQRTENPMDPELVKLVEAMTKDFDTAGGTIESRLAETKATQDRLGRELTTLNDMKAQVEAGVVSNADFKAFVDKQATEVADILTKVQEIGNARHEKDHMVQYAVKDWRALLNDKTWLRDDAGRPMPAIYQKAYKLFNLEVDYDKTESGWLVKAMRNLNDACIIMDAYYRGQNKGGYGGMQTLQTFQTLETLVDKFDPELGTAMKAMYTGDSASGGAWVPTLFSGEWDGLYRLRPQLVNYIRPAWQMPSPTAKWPLLTGAATAYLADEAATNNPPVLSKTAITLGAVTFTARTIAAAIPCSKILLEDTLIDVAPVIREELVTALQTAEEDAQINGDNSASHFDTGRSLTSSANDVKVAWKGLRKLAVLLSNTWDTQSTTAGVGDGATTFTAPDVRYNRQLLGILGLNPEDCLHITGAIAYYKALSFTQVTKANEFGFASTWLSGRLPALDGCEIYISAAMPENLNASGLYDASTTDNTGWLTINKRSFMPGEKRGVSLEFELNIDTQQWLFVATNRRDFQNMRPSTQLPVAYGYNIDN